MSPFVAYLRENGAEPGRSFEAFGLSEASVNDPNVFVHAEIIYGLLNSFSEQTGDPYLGARVGEAHDFSAWPPFAEAASVSKTLMDFFAAFVRLVPTEASSVEHSLIVGPSIATYRVLRTVEPAVSPVQVTGFGCAHYVRVLRAVTGDAWSPSEVIFESKHIDGVPPRYAGVETRPSDDPGMHLSFPVQWLFQDLKLDLEVASKRPIETIEDVDLVLAMRAAVASQLHAPDLGAEVVAELLGLDPVYLEKALKRSQTTVPREIKRLKTDTAKARLRDTDDPIGAIASDLGYKHQAHFTRFFISQTGQSPSEFRSKSRKSD